MQPATYTGGMYPLIGRPLYQELWPCEGAWAPCLGPTGLTLRDWSGFGNHGTLTNMDAATDWVNSFGRYALDFDGSNDHVTLTSGSVRPADLTVSAWVYVTSAASTGKFGGVAYSFATTTPTGADWSLSEFNGTVRVSSGGTYYNVGSLVRSTWTHIAMTRVAGAAPTAYVNGTPVSLGSGVSLGGGWTAGAAIGRWYADAAYSFQGMIDDLRVHRWAMPANAIKLLASRRGIAYELAPRRRSSVSVAAFRPYWIPRRKLIIGGGIN
jgi:hypothetical protein